MSENVVTRFVRWLISGWRWRYAGTVRAWTVYTNEDGTATNYETWGYWVLAEKGRRRRTKLVGDPGASPFALGALAKVEAWKIGGPLPEVVDPPRPPASPPKPRKTKPKTADNVVLFKAKGKAVA